MKDIAEVRLGRRTQSLEDEEPRRDDIPAACAHPLYRPGDVDSPMSVQFSPKRTPCLDFFGSIADHSGDCHLGG